MKAMRRGVLNRVRSTSIAQAKYSFKIVAAVQNDQCPRYEEYNKTSYIGDLGLWQWLESK